MKLAGKQLFNSNTGALAPKKILFLLSLATLNLVFISCGGKKDDAMVAPQGMHTLNLSRFGKPFSIFVPDTQAARLEVIEQPSGALDIKVGNNFAISINEQAADMELRKTDIKEDEVNKLKGFVVEEPTAIMWQSEITEPEYHFIINKKFGNADYSFEDVRDPEAKLFGKDAIQKMFDSSKNSSEVKAAE